MESLEKSYLLEPEVPGEWAEDIEVSVDSHPPLISKLSLDFHGWLGDSIVEVFPAFVVTEDLAEAFYANSLTGFEFRDVAISRSEQFLELYGDKELPKFVWLFLYTEETKTDIAIAEDNRLLLSQKAMTVLEEFQIEHCEVEEIA